MCIIIVPISKDEAFHLRKKGLAVNMSSRTHKARAKRYYAVENSKTLKELNKYRRSKVIYSVERE